MEDRFSEWKKQNVNKLDQSKKSSVDEDIEHVVLLLNGQEEFFTTSSCSGRIILIDAVSESSTVQKQNCVWLFVSHHKCTAEDLISGLAKSTADAVLKFEPFILHVQCRQLEDAQLLHSVAIDSGFRNSGLTVSKKGKILSAVRSTHGLEVPLSCKGKLLVDTEYIQFLTQIANQKMEENQRRIQRFYQNLHSALSKEAPQNTQIPETETETSQQLQDHPQRPEKEKGEEKPEEENNKTTLYKRRRKRKQQHQADCCHNDGSISVAELEDCLHLLT